MNWTREAVEDTFKDDVIKAVQEHFAGRAAVYVGDETEAVLPNSPADAIVVPSAGTPLALFIGTSEPKALEATLLWSDIRAKLAKAANVMLVLDAPKPKRIRDNTLARAMNRFPVTVFPGLQVEVLAAMDRCVFGDSETMH